MASSATLKLALTRERRTNRRLRALIADLRAQTLENLKAFEFTLRKKLGEPEENRVLLGRSGDVPASFKQYVEEYYRSLAKKQP